MKIELAYVPPGPSFMNHAIAMKSCVNKQFHVIIILCF